MKIYVGNLSPNTGEEQLQAAFTPHGAVTSAAVVFDRETNRSRGFGFVEMAQAPEAQAAIAALNGSTLDGNQVVVNEARPRDAGANRGGGNRR